MSEYTHEPNFFLGSIALRCGRKCANTSATRVVIGVRLLPNTHQIEAIDAALAGTVGVHVASGSILAKLNIQRVANLTGLIRRRSIALSRNNGGNVLAVLTSGSGAGASRRWRSGRRRSSSSGCSGSGRGCRSSGLPLGGHTHKQNSETNEQQIAMHFDE